MGIVMELEERHQQGEADIWCPVIYCDFCGKRIQRADEGVFLYAGVSGKPNRIYFLHARAPYHCHVKFEASHPNREGPLGPNHWSWNMLDDFISYLTNNLTPNTESE